MGHRAGWLGALGVVCIAKVLSAGPVGAQQGGRSSPEEQFAPERSSGVPTSAFEEGRQVSEAEREARRQDAIRRSPDHKAKAGARG